ncbi:hypothetical protein Tsubulata_033972, partial [Turnera subulata]
MEMFGDGCLIMSDGLYGALPSLCVLREKEKAETGVVMRGDLAIHVAARSGHLSAVKILVQCALKMDLMLRERNDLGDTALHTALRSGNEEMAKFLVQACPGVTHLLNLEARKCPLYIAAELGCLELVKMMMDNGAEPEGTDEEVKAKMVPFAALNRNETDVLDAILTKDPTLIRSRDEEGRSLLSYAAFIGNLNGVIYILKKCRMCVYERDEKSGCFPIHIASLKGHVGIIKQFLQQCPDSIELLDPEGQNLLQSAAKHGQANVVSYILKTKEFDKLLNERDRCGNTPIYLASRCGYPKIVSELCWDGRVVLNLVNHSGLTALDIAENNARDIMSFQRRLTCAALHYGGALRAPCESIVTSTRGHDSYHSNREEMRYKDRVNTLLLVSTLVATVTFAAGFTMPGGYNSSGGQHQGKATLAAEKMFGVFLVCNTIAMYSSIIVTVTLIWAQLGDINIIDTAFRLALPLLKLALLMMSIEFMAAVYLAVSNVSMLANAVLIIGSAFLATALALYLPLNSKATSFNPISRCIWYFSFHLMEMASRRDGPDHHNIAKYWDRTILCKREAP